MTAGINKIIVEKTTTPPPPPPLFPTPPPPPPALPNRTNNAPNPLNPETLQALVDYTYGQLVNQHRRVQYFSGIKPSTLQNSVWSARSSDERNLLSQYLRRYRRVYLKELARLEKYSRDTAKAAEESYLTLNRNFYISQLADRLAKLEHTRRCIRTMTADNAVVTDIRSLLKMDDELNAMFTVPAPTLMSYI